jgi:hypothetical protein
MSAYDDALTHSEMLRQGDLANARAAFESGGITGQPSRQRQFDEAVRAAEVRHAQRRLAAVMVHNNGSGAADLRHQLRQWGEAV